ncbi:hypothetical protein AB7M17_000948 [Bradyrhizobium sp. USDA 377]
MGFASLYPSDGLVRSGTASLRLPRCTRASPGIVFAGDTVVMAGSPTSVQPIAVAGR